MCGFVGAIAQVGRESSLSDEALDAWRDVLAHRGPDGAMSWREGPVALGHRRLAIRDLTDAGAQPMVAPQDRGTLVYNGELYNDAELRKELASYAARFGGFTTTCDAETVLFAMMRWGPAAIQRLRGIFALCWIDRRERRAVLARDPLGVKPLYWAVFGTEFVFASEVGALLKHPRAHAEPDLAMVSAYLTTARRELGERTMFEGIFAVRPGETLRVDLEARLPEPVSIGRWSSKVVGGDPGETSAARQVGRAVEDSLSRQLISDRPMCALLSGGFDSTVLVRLLIDATGTRPRTWCASGVEGDDELGPDPAAARQIAADLGTEHSLTRVDRATFVQQWRAHVDHLGTPLSTPNEVAIAEVARELSAEGHAVALSGEGADELFGGYGEVLDAYSAAGESDPAGAHLGAATWVSPNSKETLLQGRVLEAANGDALLRSRFVAGFAWGREQAGPRGGVLDAHLRMQREFNLAALLQRLDAATMRYGVEGRTPYADGAVTRVAEALPMPRKFQVASAGGADPVARSKIALRAAFGGRVPDLAIRRPKASFPLPFQRWGAEVVANLPRSRFANELVRPEMLEALAARPEAYWRLAWPIANLALWGDKFWG